MSFRVVENTRCSLDREPITRDWSHDEGAHDLVATGRIDKFGSLPPAELFKCVDCNREYKQYRAGGMWVNAYPGGDAGAPYFDVTEGY